MTKQCQSCDKPFEAKRSAAKYCGDTCRKRAQRAPSAKPAATRPADSPHAGLVAAIRDALVRARVEDTWLGQLAQTLAFRIEFGIETGAAIASLSKDLRAVMADATKSAKKSVSALDGIRGASDDTPLYSAGLRIVPRLPADQRPEGREAS